VGRGGTAPPAVTSAKVPGQCSASCPLGDLNKEGPQGRFSTAPIIIIIIIITMISF
jgi:hypothetical protein